MPPPKFNDRFFIGNIVCVVVENDLLDDPFELKYMINQEFLNNSWETLVEKFGKPERDPIVKMQNGFGAQWEEIHADWTFPDGATLQYRSGKGGREHGSITATAGVVEKEREARRAASRATERGL